MIVEDTEFQMIQNLSVLYELSLAVSDSTDIRKNCENFLNILMSRKNLSFAGYWIFNREKNRMPELIHAVPFKNYTAGKTVFNHRFTHTLKKEGSLIIDIDSLFFNEIAELTQLNYGSFLVYCTASTGILLLHRSTHPFSTFEKKQLNKVVQKFGSFTKEMILQKTLLTRENMLREAIESELSIAQSQYRNLFDNALDAVFLYDNNINKITHHNKAFEKIFGFNPSEETLYPTAIMPQYQKDGKLSSKHIEAHNKMLETCRSIRIDFLHQRANGEQFESETTLINDEGSKRGYLVIVKDTSEQKKQQALIQQQLEDLNEQNEKLQQYIDSNKQLENFAYMASHDLQSPLRSVIGFAQLLGRTFTEDATKTQKEYLDFIISASLNMQQLIKSLLEYSRINSTQLEVKNINIQNLLEVVIAESHAIIQEKKATVHIQNLPKTLRADPTKLRQIFQNLLTNALKFVQPNVTPTIHITGEELPEYWRFSIKDNGIGIKPEFQEKIFKIFQRLHTKQEYEGTGIGLATCHRIAEQHSGDIYVESEFGKGSTFYFTIRKDL